MKQHELAAEPSHGRGLVAVLEHESILDGDNCKAFQKK
jgi:hypothetical protein